MTRENDWAILAAIDLLPEAEWSIIERIAAALRAERASTAARCADIASEVKQAMRGPSGGRTTQIRAACLIREQIKREFPAVARAEGKRK